MSKQSRRYLERRSPDMAVYPQPQTYDPPDRGECNLEETPIYFDQGNDRLLIRQWIYRGKVADFVLVQETFHNGEWCEVSRIDCKHSVVHRHQFAHTGDEIGRREKIVTIPRDGTNVVTDALATAIDQMIDRWK